MTAPAASSLITTSFWSAQITANLLECAPAKFSARGDGFFATGANAGARVPVGANLGNPLVANSSCTTGVAFDNTLRITGSHVGIGASPGPLAILAILDETNASSNHLFLGAGSTTGYRIGRNVVNGVLEFSGCQTTFEGFQFITRDSGCVMYVGASGLMCIGSASTNANMTTGLTIQQGAADNEILALKSSDVAHGMTTLAETDTFGNMLKASATAGGLDMRGFSETNVGLRCVGVATTEDTTKAVNSVAAIHMYGGVKSGTDVGVMSASANVLVITSAGFTEFIFDGSGNSYENIGTAWTNFDEHDDAHLLNVLAAHATRPDDPLKDNFGEYLKENRDSLQKMGLVYFNDDGSIFLNTSRHAMLLNGAVRQLAVQNLELRKRLDDLSGSVLQISGQI